MNTLNKQVPLTIKMRLRRLAEWLTNTRIFRRLPRGISISNDIRDAMPDYRFKIIFDVGANIGQSSDAYLILYPSAEIYSFEPIAASFQELQNSAGLNPRVHCLKLALGSKEGVGKMLSDGIETTNRILTETDLALNDKDKPIENVDISTLDEFCSSQGISQISYLKIDAEGGDLAVLQGAANMLLSQGIDFIEVEAGMTALNQYHVPYGQIRNYLDPLNYHLFGVYEQVSEWNGNEPQLRRANLVFISMKMIDACKAGGALECVHS